MDDVRTMHTFTYFARRYYLLRNVNVLNMYLYCGGMYGFVLFIREQNQLKITMIFSMNKI